MDLFDDKRKTPKNKEKEIVLSLLRKCEADFEYLSKVSTTPSLQPMYRQCSEELKTINEQLSPYVSPK